jgi:hypothetical protein
MAIGGTFPVIAIFYLRIIVLQKWKVFSVNHAKLNANSQWPTAIVYCPKLKANSYSLLAFIQ